eukprot:TRINITY_DN2465_c0_g1_i3.p1 TRINITY_DN2465_c0_g1~~TRINITY_DN2465_c0_g1_i3.p1  ORF type:complete len:124 (+),score=19.19 TRINITY_DN2465_c0_g1_i3:362-733(+)
MYDESMKTSYLKDGNGYVIVYSITDKSSFEQVKEIYKNLKNIQKTFQERDDFPCVVLGNKCDLAQEREVNEEDGIDLANTMKTKLFETSAKNDINISQAFIHLVKIVKNDPKFANKKKRKGDL